MEPIVIDKSFAKSLLKPLAPGSHKGTQGHALLIGGSYGKIGAMVLSTKAALRAGCGLASAYIPKCGYQILQTAVPEAMVITDPKNKAISTIEYNISPDVVGIGPGLGQDDMTRDAFAEFLKSNQPPLVLDADAINLLSANQQLLKHLPQQAVLTPHAREWERLVGKSNSVAESIDKAMLFSETYKAVIVLKGAPTHIIFSNTLYRNTTGNAALATAGSGDVLTGIITGLLAQGTASHEAATLGVYLHGLTADMAKEHRSFIASDIIDNLPDAYLSLSIS